MQQKPTVELIWIEIHIMTGAKNSGYEWEMAPDVNISSQIWVTFLLVEYQIKTLQKVVYLWHVELVET